MKNILKKEFIPLLCMFFLLFVFLNANNWSDFLVKYTINDPKIAIPTQKRYPKQENFLFVQNTNEFTPYSRGDIKNIYYTIVNNGWEEFTFYCPAEYKTV